MIEKIWSNYLAAFLLLMIPFSMYGQDPLPQNPTQLPSNIPSSVIERAQQLRSQGLSNQQIQEMLKRENANSTIFPSAPANPASNIPNPVANQNEQQSEGQTNDKTDQQAEEESSESDTVSVKQDFEQVKDIDVESMIFGQHLYQLPGIKFELDQSNKPDDNYVIDVGDEFNVSIWGPSELNEPLIVDKDGAIYRPFIGKIYVAGRTYAEARESLKQAYQRIVGPGSTISISLGEKQRTISISIVGSVRKPGTYKIYANNTVFNALFYAGGLTATGSVRNIEVRRRGEIVYTFDMYEYLLGGNKPPVYLREGDYIFVPVQRKVVKISGEVKSPMFYELKENEDLSALVSYAGGTKYIARKDIVRLKRLEGASEKLIDIPFKEIREKGEDISLQDGDWLHFETLEPSTFNLVEVLGAVSYEGGYELEAGDRVTDILQKAGGISNQAYMDKAYITRFLRPGELAYIPFSLSQAVLGDTIHNLKLQYFDQIRIFSENEFKDNKKIRIEGEVREPGSFPLSPTMTLKDLLFLSGGPTEEADLNNIQLIVVTEASDEDSKVFRKENGELALPDESSETEGDDPELNAEPEGTLSILEPSSSTDEELGIDEETSGDKEVISRIAIKENWQVDSALDTVLLNGFNKVRVYSKFDFIYKQYIQVEGAINKPGRYQVLRGMSLKDILYLAGGLKEKADLKEVELYKLIDIEEKGYFSTKTPKKELIRIALDNDDWQTSKKADSIEVSSYYKVFFRSKGEFMQKGMVKVAGLVNAPGQYTVLPNMTLKDLFYLANGFKVEADLNNIELSRIIEVEDGSGRIVPRPIVIRTISTIQDWETDDRLDQIELNSFDQVFIRKNPAFEIQESVFIEGEVVKPGEYNKISKSERLSSLVKRAMGVTSLAYLEGAYLVRNLGKETHKVAIKLDKAIGRPNSKHDIPLLDNDHLIIPPRLDLVTIEGNVMQSGNTVVYDPDRTRFKHYVNLAGGFSKRTRRKGSQVAYMDGRVKGTKSFMFMNFYPKVEQEVY